MELLGQLVGVTGELFGVAEKTYTDLITEMLGVSHTQVEIIQGPILRLT